MKKMKGIKEKQLNHLTMIQPCDLQNTVFPFKQNTRSHFKFLFENE